MKKEQKFKFLQKMNPLVKENDPIFDFYALLHQEIGTIGRIYVCNRCFIFYSNIFGYITQLCFNWEDVTNITKEYVLINIPNALKIHTASDSMLFSSITNRDARFLDMLKIWCASTGKDYQEFVKNDSGTDNVLTEVDKQNTSSQSVKTIDGSLQSMINIPESVSLDESAFQDSNSIIFSHERETKSEPDDTSIKSGDDPETSIHSTGEEPELNCGEFLSSICINDSIWPYSPHQLFMLLFDNDSTVVKDYLVKMKIEGYSCEKFKPIDQFRLVRVVNYCVNALMIGKVETTSTQILTQNSKKTHFHLHVTNKANISLLSDVCNVYLYYCITEVSPCSSNLKICVSLEFTKKLYFVENKLRRNILSSTEEFVNSLLSLLDHYTRLKSQPGIEKPNDSDSTIPTLDNSNSSSLINRSIKSIHNKSLKLFRDRPENVDRLKNEKMNESKNASSRFHFSIDILNGWGLASICVLILLIWIISKFCSSIAILTDQIAILSKTLRENEQMREDRFRACMNSPIETCRLYAGDAGIM